MKCPLLALGWLGASIVFARLALATSFLCLSFSNVLSADIQIEPLKDNVSIISVSGEFSDGDDLRFKNLAISADSAVVFFDSIGGLAQVGMEIGRTIAIKGFSTAVATNQICASSAGLPGWQGDIAFSRRLPRSVSTPHSLRILVSRTSAAQQTRWSAPISSSSTSIRTLSSM